MSVGSPAVQTGTCPVCSSRLSPYMAEIPDTVTGHQFRVLKCDACGVGITDPFPEHLQPYYAGYYGSRHSITARFCARRRVALVSKMAGPAQGRRLLDVGCGDGTFLGTARERGWDVVGSELNPEPARKAGFEVYGSLEECARKGPFGCITLWHSLEHMTDPRAVLTKIRELVSEDGVVLIAVPNFDGLQSRAFRERWLHLDVPRHLYHFTASSMDRMLNDAQFAAVAHWHQEFEYDLIGWWQSALNSALPTPNVLFDYLARKKVRGTLLDRVLSGVSAPIAVFLSLPLVWLGSLAGRGGTLLVAARTRARQMAKAAGD